MRLSLCMDGPAANTARGEINKHEKVYNNHYDDDCVVLCVCG